MAINVSFNGATIYKPGAYSQVSIDLGGGFPLSPTGLVAIFGESDKGAPGSSVPNISNNFFTPDELPLIKNTYGNGPIVDACNFLFAPGADGAIPGGAQAVYIYKTNASTRASLALTSSYGTVQSLAYGIGGNLITYKSTAVPAVGPANSSSAPFDLTSGIYSGGQSSHLDDADSIQAQTDAAAAYTSLAAHAGYVTIPNTLDGQSLTAGYYTFASGDVHLATTLPGTLTLTGSATDVFVFKTPSTLTTGAGATPTITLAGGALAKNVYWLIGSSATINSGNPGVFNGNIIATTAITDTLGGTVNGSMIALGAAITLSAAANVNAQFSPLLLTAREYAILGASAVTMFAGSVVRGKVGSSPTGTVTGYTTSMSVGGTLALSINGGATNTFSIPSAVTTRAALQAALNLAGNWSGGLPAGMTFTVGGATDAAATVAISMSGSGNFAIIGGSLVGSGEGTINIGSALIGPTSQPQIMITLSNKSTLIDESGTVGGNVVLELGRYGAGNVSPNVTLNATSLILSNNSAVEATITLANFGTVSQLVLFINSGALGLNWSASAGSNLMGQLPISVLDQVSAVPAASSSPTSWPVQIKKDAFEVEQFFAQSSNASLIPGAGIVQGLPDASAETYLAGGTLGASSTADMVNALTAFTKIHVNSVVPLFSRDAAADIADGFTDGASNYTIDGIHQAVKTHLSLMATTKKKSERQGYLSLKDTYVNCKAEIAVMADARIQMNIQDVRQIDSNGVIKWFMPWAGSAMLAGARGGSPVGNPMTFKYFNMSGIRQTAQPMSTPEANIHVDFDPDIQYDDAIANGVTFWEAPQTGGFRLVVDNTTYGKDGNWVYNRANVLYAADVLAYDFRNQMENIYIGLKNTVSASEISSTAAAILTTYLAQGITVSTSDAKNGYKQLVVQMNGNVVNISVVVKLVEGIDFILEQITLQRASQTA